MMGFDQDKENRLEEGAAIAAHALLKAFQLTTGEKSKEMAVNAIATLANSIGLSLTMIMRTAIKIDKEVFEKIVGIGGVGAFTSKVNSSIYTLEFGVLPNDRRLKDERILKGMKRTVRRTHNAETIERFKRAVLREFMLKPFNLMAGLVGLPEAVVLTLDMEDGAVTAKTRIILALTLDKMEEARTHGENIMKKEGELAIMIGQSEKAGTVRLMMFANNGEDAKGICLVSYVALEDGQGLGMEDVKKMDSFYNQEDHDEWISGENRKAKAREQKSSRPRWENN